MHNRNVQCVTVCTACSGNEAEFAEKVEAHRQHTARLEEAEGRVELVFVAALRESLEEEAYRREHRVLRDAARPLAEIRDAFMLRRILRALAPRPATLVGILDKDYQQARSRLEHRGAKVVLVQLNRVRKQLIVRLPATPELFSAAAGVRRIYRAGAKASEKARSRDDEALHEWRKQTMYLLNQLDLLKAVFGANFKQMRRQAHELGDALGDDHDLSILQEKLHRSKERDRVLVREIKAQRPKLQARSVRIGKKLYRHSAKHV